MPIIQSLDRALHILDLFDEHTPQLKITEISARMQLHKSTVHSLLKTLMAHGYVDQEEESGKYKLGLRWIEKGQLLLQSLDVRTVARKKLLKLSMDTGQTAHLVILHGKEGVYIDKVEGEKAAIRYSRLGGRVPLHCSAVGKVLTAFQTGDKMRELLSGYVFVQHTPHTILDRQVYLRELSKVRSNGYAMDDEENEPGVRCAAAPIFDHAGQIAAAISLSTMTSIVGGEELRRYIVKLRSEADKISQLLGFRTEFKQTEG